MDVGALGVPWMSQALLGRENVGQYVPARWRATPLCHALRNTLCTPTRVACSLSRPRHSTTTTAYNVRPSRFQILNLSLEAHVLPLIGHPTFISTQVAPDSFASLAALAPSSIVFVAI